MINYLPLVLRQVREMRAILAAAEQPQFSGVWGSAENALNDQFVMTATVYGVARWEGILGLKPKASDNLNDRKFRIISRLNEALPYTITTLHSMMAALCGEDGYVLDLHHNSYTLTVKVALTAKPNYEDVELLLHRVVPANIVIELSLKYNQHMTLAGFTHAELQRYTHTDLRNEVLTHA